MRSVNEAASNYSARLIESKSKEKEPSCGIKENYRNMVTPMFFPPTSC